MGKWTSFNTGVLSSRKDSLVIEESKGYDTYDFNDIMASSEAIMEAAEAKYIAKEVLESFYDFNADAEERKLSAMEYIAEAFDIKGIVKKVFDVLVRFWGVIVSYIKTTLSKFSSSSDLKKRLLDLVSAAETLSQAKFGQGKVKFKRFGLNTAVVIAGKLLDAKTYIETPLVKDDNNSSIARITAESAQLADVDLKFDRQANGEKQKGEASDLNSKGTTLKNLNDRVLSISKSIGIGKSGSVGILLYLLGRTTIGTGADLKTSKAILDLPEVAKAKDASAFLRALLLELFPGTAEIYESKDIAGEVKYIIKTATGIYNDSKSSQLADGNKAAVSEDGFGEARKQAQEILDQLKSAATKIGQFKANDVDTDNKNDLGAQKENEKAAGDVADVSGKLSTNLMEIQSSMQEALTKGMDSGLVIIKTVITELEFRVKSIQSLAGGRTGIEVRMDNSGKGKDAKGKDAPLEGEVQNGKEDKSLKAAQDLDAGA